MIKDNQDNFFKHNVVFVNVKYPELKFITLREEKFMLKLDFLCKKLNLNYEDHSGKSILF